MKWTEKIRKTDLSAETPVIFFLCKTFSNYAILLSNKVQLADEYGVEFFETSALTGINVEKMFYGFFIFFYL